MLPVALVPMVILKLNCINYTVAARAQRAQARRRRAGGALGTPRSGARRAPEARRGEIWGESANRTADATTIKELQSRGINGKNKSGLLPEFGGRQDGS